MDLKEIGSAMEAILFAAGEPVGVERLCLALDIDRATADAVAQRLMDTYSYERRGVRILRLDTAYQMVSAPEHADRVRKAFESRKPAKLSPPALEVLAVIAAAAALEVEGVASLAPNLGNDLAELLGKKSNLSKGVHIAVNEDAVKVELSILVEYGSVIPEVAGAVQEAVFDAVDNTSGLHVECVNVNVAGVVFAKEPKKQG